MLCLILFEFFGFTGTGSKNVDNFGFDSNYGFDTEPFKIPKTDRVK